MNITTEDSTEFEFEDKFTARALEMLDASQALEFAEGLRLGGSLSSVHAREYARLERKYGKEHPRTQEMAVRMEANEIAKKVLFTRYVAASTPQTDPGDGWAVDGFVRTAAGDPVASITVAAYDQENHWYKDLGYGCTNERGYFTFAATRLPDKEITVYLRPSKGKKLIPANEVQLTPKAKSGDRVEIILTDEEGKGDCVPPSGRSETRPPNEPPGDRRDPASHTTKGPRPGEVRARPAGATPRNPTPAQAPSEPATTPKAAVPAEASPATAEHKVMASTGAPEKPKEPGRQPTAGGAETTHPKRKRKR